MRTIRQSPTATLVRLIAGVALAGLLALVAAAPSSGTDRGAGVPGHRAVSADPPTATLDSVGTRYVAAPIPIKGFSWGASSGKHRLALQRYAPLRHRWFTHAVTYADSGVYRFRPRHVWSPRTVRFRTVLYDDGRRVAVSNVITVEVVSPPAP